MKVLAHSGDSQDLLHVDREPRDVLFMTVVAVEAQYHRSREYCMSWYHILCTLDFKPDDADLRLVPAQREHWASHALRPRNVDGTTFMKRVFSFGINVYNSTRRSRYGYEYDTPNEGQRQDMARNLSAPASCLC
ncbi:unnamed protein product [Hapterophycus canaliculatus]